MTEAVMSDDFEHIPRPNSMPLPPRPRSRGIRKALRALEPNESIFFAGMRKESLSAAGHAVFGAGNYAVRRELDDDGVVIGSRIWRLVGAK